MTKYPEDIMKAAEDVWLEANDLIPTDAIIVIADAILDERQRCAKVAANEAERISENEPDYSGSRVHDMLVTARRIQAAISGDENIHLSDAVRARITNTSEVQA